jgi:lipid II:glycine glycyltransferase (peptidoglycan interpeptide bridge formation enzyme)
VYVRFQSQGQTQPELSYYLSRACRRPTFRINSGFTTWIDLSTASADLISGMDGKHRYYTKKSRSFNIDWRCGADAELIRDLVELNREVVARKGVNWIATTEAEVQRMTAAVGNGALILVGYVDGKPAAACLALIFGRSAFYMIAASNEIGHKCHASYGLIERLWAELQARGVTNLDFGGLDPFVPGAAGVNHFKLGFGGPIVEYLGEWEWASKRWIGWLGNAGVRMRIKRV